MSLGTVVIASEIVPVDAVLLRDGKIQFVCQMPRHMEGDLSQEEYRIHGDDGSLICLVDGVSSVPVVKKRGEPMTLYLPLAFVEQRARL